MKIDKLFFSPIAVFKNENEKFDLTDHCLNIKDKYSITGHKNWIHNPTTLYQYWRTKLDIIH